MRSNVRILVAALLGVSIFSVAASAYAYRARDSAIRGWADATQVRIEADRLRAEAAVLSAENKTPQCSGPNAIVATVARMIGVDPKAPPETIERSTRDYVYSVNIVGGTGHTDRGDDLAFFELGRKDGEMQCGGMSTAHAWALNTLGIQARVVQLAGMNYLSGDDYYQTHVTVEAKIGGKWRISDPTFNASFDCSDGTKNLSVYDAKRCVDNGDKLVAKFGETQLPGRTLAGQAGGFASYLVAISALPRAAKINQIEPSPHAGWVAETIKRQYSSR